MLSSSLAPYTVIIIEVNGGFLFLFFDTSVLHKQYAHQYSMKLFIWRYVYHSCVWVCHVFLCYIQTQ